MQVNMQNPSSASTTEAAAILHLIQRTPCVEVLIKLLRRKGYPSVNEKKVGTRYQKCRRLYDVLLQECHSYTEEKFDALKKIFHDSENGEAGELLSALVKGPLTPLFLGPDAASIIISNQDQVQLRRCDVSTSREVMTKIFQVAKSGNAQKLEVLLRGVALKCAGFESPLSPTGVRRYAVANQVNIASYRTALGEVLLDKKDYMDKSLLHLAVDGKSIACIDVVLQFGQEAHRKGDLLDGVDAFGQTALYVAIKRKYAQITKKLIGEGSDLFLANSREQTPLGLIFQRLPAVTTYLLDRSVTITGDISNDSLLFLNIDFGILTAPIDITKEMGESPMKLFPIAHLKDADCQKAVLDLGSSSDEENPTQAMFDISPESLHQKRGLPIPRSVVIAEKSAITHKNPTPKKVLNRMEMTILAEMVNSGHKCLWDTLAHPVTQTFLDLKWARMRYLLWSTYTGLRIGIYGLYIFLMYRVYFHHCPLNRKRDGNEATCGWSPWTQGLLPIVLVFNTAFLLHELIKAADFKKMRDFKRYLLIDPGPHVFIRLLFISIVVGTCLPPFLDGTLNAYQYVLATLGILICAGLILEVLGNSNCNFGIYSIYIHIYGKVMLRFLSVIATFSPLLISFSLAFNIMYPQMRQFSSFLRSLLRLIIMLQGEFDFEDKMYSGQGGRPLEEEQENGPSNNSTSHLSRNDEDLIFWAGQLLFALLGCVLTLVLIDVFLGYTVSDINELKTQAEFVRRWNQIIQMDEAERFIRMAAKFLELFGIDSDAFVDHFNVISTKRRKNYRTDIVVSFEELSESRQAQFRTILTEPS